MNNDEIQAIRERHCDGMLWAHGVPGAIVLSVAERDALCDALAAKERQLAEAERTIQGAHKSITHLSQQAHLEWTRAEQAERERDEAREAAEQLGAKVDKAERLALQHYAAAEHAEAALAALQEKVE